MGDIRPSSRVSIFSDDHYGAEGGRAPITEHQNSRKQHLPGPISFRLVWGEPGIREGNNTSAKAGEWNEPGIRESINTASQIYMKYRENESGGSSSDSSSGEDVFEELTRKFPDISAEIAAEHKKKEKERAVRKAKKLEENKKKKRKGEKKGER